MLSGIADVPDRLIPAANDIVQTVSCFVFIPDALRLIILAIDQDVDIDKQLLPAMLNDLF